MILSSARRSRRPILLAISLALAVLLAGCDRILVSPPPAKPSDFNGLAVALSIRGVGVEHPVSGDPGCPDQDLAPTAITFVAAGLDQRDPTPLYLYHFRNQAAYERLRAAVDACTLAYQVGTEPAPAVDASPFVLAGPGPWAPEFRNALREALIVVAGG